MTRERLDELAVRVADALEGEDPVLIELVELVEHEVGIVWSPGEGDRPQDPPVVLARRFARAYAAAIRGGCGGRAAASSDVAVGAR